MNRLRLVKGAVSAAVLAAVAGSATLRVSGQTQIGGQGTIPSLTEPGQGLTIRQTSPVTGRVTFASTDNAGILLAGAVGAAAETRARSFLQIYGSSFGITTDAQVRLRNPPSTDRLGIEHVRFQQVHQGIPVVGGELIVHLRGVRVTAANGRTVDNLPADVTPTVVPADAQAAARQLLQKTRPGQAAEAELRDPQLQILNRGVFDDTPNPSRLAWFVEATAFDLDEYIWVDAHSGDAILHFNQVADAKNRNTYNTNHTSSLPGTLARSEGQGPVGDADVDNAHNFAGITYDYYFNSFGRDSVDNAGLTLTSTTHYLTGYQNAFWNGSQMVYGDGFASADDVVGHELTHGVTQYTAGLFYFEQSGALNESFSDIHGETIDLTDGVGNDTPGVRWLLGEDLSIGAIRSMADPTIYSNPGKMSDSAYFECTGSDNGGVHTNSGVPNHAYELMTDGGTYNNRTITGIGLAKASQIEYRAETTYLTTASGFLDNYMALNQACTDLTGQFSITASDCTQVKLATDAVEMNKTWGCSGNINTPPLCPTGAAPTATAFSDGFESGTLATNWSTVGSVGTTWFANNQLAQTGVWDAAANDVGFVSDQRLTKSVGVVVAAGARLYFSQLYDLEGGFDGAVLEYSTNAGSTWNDAASMIDGGRVYDGVLSNGFSNPLGGRSAWTGPSHGYTATRLDISSLAGQTALFRFRLGTDSSTGTFAWVVDNVQIYTCAKNAAGEFMTNGGFGTGDASSWLVFGPDAGPIPPGTAADMRYQVSGNEFQWYRPAGSNQGVVFQNTGVGIPGPFGFAPGLSNAPSGGLEAIFDIGNSTTALKRISVLIYESDFSDVSVCTFYMAASVGMKTYHMRSHPTKPWTNASIAFYAANVGNEGSGFYRLDNVSLKYRNDGTISSYRTECVDPNAPVGGGVSSGDTMTNGNFSTPLGACPGDNCWFTFGNISSQVTAGVFQFFKLAGAPAGVVAQSTGTAIALGQRVLATFQLGNTSGIKQRVTVLLNDKNFAGLSACTFYLLPGQALNTYSMRTYASQAWPDAMISVYPASAGTAPTYQWLTLDNVSYVETTSTTIGTECIEPGG